MDRLLFLLGINAATTLSEGMKLYKFKDLVSGNQRIRNYFDDDEQVLCISKMKYLLEDNNALYISADMALLVLYKHLDSSEKRFMYANCLLSMMESNTIINTTNTMESNDRSIVLEEGTVPDVLMSESNTTNSTTLNSIESNGNVANIVDTVEQVKKKTKIDIDREQIQQSQKKLTIRNIEEEKNKRKSNETRKEIQKQKKIKTIQSQEARSNVENKINTKLKETIEKHDEKIVKGVDVGRLNLCADDDARCARLVHNSTRVGSFENSFTRAKEQADDFFKTYEEMAHEANLRFAHVLYGYFLKNPIEAMNLVSAIAESCRPENVKEEDFVAIKNLQHVAQQSSLPLQLKVKDEGGFCNRSWKLLCYTLGVNLQPDLTSFTKEVNGLLVEFFGLEQKLNGFIVKLKPVLEALVKAHLHNIEKRKSLNLPIPNDILPSSLKVKLSMDGRTLGNLRTVVVTLQILNLATYGTQERLSVFPLALYIGEESEVKQYVEHFKNEIVDLTESGLKIEQAESEASLGLDSALIAIDFYWVSDLASLGYISLLRENDGFCFGCRCKRRDSKKTLGINDPTSPPPDLQHNMGIATGNIYFCILHMDERVTEYLMKLTLVSKNVEDTVTTNLRKLPGFKHFSFTVAEKGKNKNNSKIEETNSIGVQDYSFMLSGSHCATIFGFLENVIGFTKEESPNPYSAWYLWKQIRRWIYLTNEELAQKSSDDFIEFRDKLNEFGNDIRILRNSSDCVSDYIHIAVNHLFTTMATIGSLVPLSNQAVESSHELDRFIMSRSTSRGKMMEGKKKRKVSTTSFQVERTSQPISHELSSPATAFSYDSLVHATAHDWNDLYQLCQIMMKRYRILYLSFKHEDVTFKRLELRKGKVLSTFWTRDLSNLLQPPGFMNHEGKLMFYNNLAPPQCVDNLQDGNIVDTNQIMESMSQRRPLTDWDLANNTQQDGDDVFLAEEDLPNTSQQPPNIVQLILNEDGEGEDGEGEDEDDDWKILQQEWWSLQYD